jgi:hypothetical protein
VLKILSFSKGATLNCDTETIGKRLNDLAGLLLRSVQVSLYGSLDLEFKIPELLSGCDIGDCQSLLGAYRFNALQPEIHLHPSAPSRMSVSKIFFLAFCSFRFRNIATPSTNGFDVVDRFTNGRDLLGIGVRDLDAKFLT